MMDLVWIGLCLFSFVLSTVILAGYLVLKPAANARQEAENVQPAEEEDPSAPAQRPRGYHRENLRSAILDFFQSIGDRFPGSRKAENPYRQRLQMAGFRRPSALSIYYGI